MDELYMSGNLADFISTHESGGSPHQCVHSIHTARIAPAATTSQVLSVRALQSSKMAATFRSSFKFGNVETKFKYSRFPGLAKNTVYDDGVSSYGLCTNPACILYEEDYLTSHGYGFYRPAVDKTSCPACKTVDTQVIRFAFSKANILIRYKKEGETSVRTRLMSEIHGDFIAIRWMPECEQVKYVFIEVFSCSPGCAIPEELYSFPKPAVPTAPNK